MTEKIVAQKSPYQVDVTAGKSYMWCQCGRSRNQPFCDGSHAGTGFTPVKYSPTEDKKVFMCGCKQTKNQPMCDGSHMKL